MPIPNHDDNHLTDHDGYRPKRPEHHHHIACNDHYNNNPAHDHLYHGRNKHDHDHDHDNLTTSCSDNHD